VLIDSSGLDALIVILDEAGFDTKGPVVRDGAIVPGVVRGVEDLPQGWHDDQAPGRYRLVASDDSRYFAWAVGPGSWKADVLPPSQELWRGRRAEGSMAFSEPASAPTPIAVIGARPCELAALDVLDRVLRHGQVPDPRYAASRDGAFVVVVECGTPGRTCFCASMGSGPAVADGFDLALAELDDSDGHRFVVRAGSERGAAILARLETHPATEKDMATREEMLDAARRSMGRRLDTERLAALLERNLRHPRWDEVASRCLACGNCTSVCPTCFCTDVRDTSDLSGEIRRERRWGSCFDLDYSYLHGGIVRSSIKARYRQWLTHKLSTWWDQFGSSGCVGCGRCITWCPVGIDLTEEAAAIRRTDGEVPSSTTGARVT
jgi:sulfhydrogenase subunit beta (sulfur reductase)